ncbi:hypothetical protein LJR232_002577 [Aquipseudomonas alcaligenes]
MSFPSVEGVKIDARKLPKHTWNADLIDFDGPFLSLYRSEVGEDILYAWLDCSDIRHRWCMIPVSRKNLRSYLECEVSLLDLYKQSEWLVLFHTGKTVKRSWFLKTVWQSLPDSYLPQPESYFSPEVATPAAMRLAAEVSEEYFLGLNGEEVYIDDLSIIPRVYQQLYSFHYGLDYIDRPAVQSALTRLASDWSGGISAVNIFTGLKQVTPSIHRARVTEMRFNSPGHIKLDLLGDLAARIEHVAALVTDESAFLKFEEYYAAVYSYFRKNKISGFDDERRTYRQFLTPAVMQELEGYVDQFFTLMHWQGYKQHFEKIEIGALHQLRLLLAYYRRLRKLRPYLISGVLTLGSSQLLKP